MDSITTALIREGGGWLTSAILLSILAVSVKIAWELLKREWMRSDRQDAIVSTLVSSNERLLEGQKRLEDTQVRILDGMRNR